MFAIVPVTQTLIKDIKEAFCQSISFKLKSCIRRASDTIDKRFCFDIISDNDDVLTFQALSDEDRRCWLNALDGKEPVNLFICLMSLPEPLMTYALHGQFLSASKLDSAKERVEHIHYYVHQLPNENFRMLKLLMHHLKRVAECASQNLMTACNLAVCFGPCVLRAEEETVAAIMDIKFYNLVVEVLIDNCDQVSSTNNSR
ncbi:RhoGAP domain protein [Trichinella nativa]|uniref:RhoGAP domain protein n=1 Tax=Trichinella nativa TaxID=6335 RepID=A0A1Y3EY98_9BILA|nr:RhoGAP domain protein [Trichinella nativa]